MDEFDQSLYRRQAPQSLATITAENKDEKKEAKGEAKGEAKEGEGKEGEGEEKKEEDPEWLKM